MNTKQTKRERPTPTLLEVLDEWGRANEKRMRRQQHARREQRNKYN